MSSRMTTTEAIEHMRRQPEYADLIRDSYLDADVDAAVARFLGSVELRETVKLLPPIENLTILDLGAGTGLAARAFRELGAPRVIALEPECDAVIGLGALAAAPPGQQVLRVAAFGDAMPLATGSVDLVYVRQVLHHIPDLPSTLRECARVLRPGGQFIAVREHVVDDEAQLAEFLAVHQVHQLAGGEGAHSLPAYRDAITGAGLELTHELATWDSVVNAYPAVTNDDELARAPEVLLAQRGGPALGAVGRLPGVRDLVWRRLKRPKPGRLYSFVARKPG
jgi:SAM-dependent methyltransferase